MSNRLKRPLIALALVGALSMVAAATVHAKTADPATPKADYLRPVFDAAWNAGGYPSGTDIRPDGKLDLGSGYVPRD